MATFCSVLHLFLLLASSAARVRPCSAAKPLGFSMKLIHRDSPKSPLYDPLSTPTQRNKQAILRSRRRSQQLASAFANSKIFSSVEVGSGEYLMEMSIGTPSRSYWLTLDTGSDISWVACRPCETCFVHQDSLFDAHRSRSYRRQSCFSGNCALLDGRCDANQLCVFLYSYADDSAISGNLGSETVAFDYGDGDEIRFSEIVFGCVHGQSAPHPSLLEQPGLVALSQGPVSLISQIGPTIGRKFAYCLPPLTPGSEGWLRFGNNADDYPGEHQVKVVSMGQYGPQGNFYRVLLEDISVEEERVSIRWRPPLLADEDARSLVLDSGSEFTYLAPYVYDQVKEAVEQAVDGESFVMDDLLCYHALNEHPYDGLPGLTLHFDDADWKLPPPNVFKFFEGPQGTGSACLAIQPDLSEVVGLLGSLAQQNMFIKFDLGNGLLSFAPMDCDDD